MTTSVELYPDEVWSRITEAIRLTRAGLSAPVIAARLNVTPRTVTRYRARARASQ